MSRRSGEAYDRERGLLRADRGHDRRHGRSGGARAAARAPRARRSGRPRPPRPAQGPPLRPPETVSRDWTSGRSTQGGGYDESMRAAEGFGAAGPPPGRPSGRVLDFGRYAGWSLGEVARHDIEYIEWLDRAPIGRNYRARARRHPAAERPAAVGRGRGQPTAEGCSAAARRPASRRRSAAQSLEPMPGRRPSRSSCPGRAA